MLQIIKKLYQIGLISPIGFCRLLASLFSTGINLMALLRFAAKTHPQKTALTDDDGSHSYQNLWSESEQLAQNLHQKYQLDRGDRIALICRNHAALVQSLFAVSRLGCDTYLLNIEMKEADLKALTERYQFKLIIYDPEIENLVDAVAGLEASIPTYQDTSLSINQLAKEKIGKPLKIKKRSAGKLVILTGGTTGLPKAAVRKPSLFTFLNPLFALLVRLNLNNYRSVYVATPIYHGFGVAAVIVSLLLGANMILAQRFKAEDACVLIEQQQAEVVTLVPLMLRRMLLHRPEALASLGCIIAGGAPLSPALVEQTAKLLGADKLANLYGTSEAGFSIMATSLDLKYANNTIGKKIRGVRLRVLDAQNKEVKTGAIGQLCIRSKWTMTNKNTNWVGTGDLGYVDTKGYYFLCGRIDDMIVSGGENVYPIELENIMIQHPQIQEVAVIGISDKEFGQRLKAFVVLERSEKIEVQSLFDWLVPRISRHQKPAQIEFIGEIPQTALGKPDKKELRLR